MASATQDCFYKDLTQSEREEAYNQNYNSITRRPSTGRGSRMRSSSCVAAPESVSVPSYDFVTHSRLPSEHDTIVSAPEIVIFEGILALHDEEVRSLFDLKIFVDADAGRASRGGSSATWRRAGATLAASSSSTRSS